MILESKYNGTSHYRKIKLSHDDNVEQGGGGGGGGGGGTLIFSSYVGSGPASTVHAKKLYQDFKQPKKNI